jgi:ferric-dicitrate binding protein FerR (iron transport regulator)
VDRSSRAWELLAKALANELDKTERLEFDQLLNTTPELAAQWRLLQRTGVNSSGNPVSAHNKEERLSAIFAQGQPQLPSAKRFPLKSWAIAAAVFGIAVTVGYSFFAHHNKESQLVTWTNVSTKPGARYKVVLPDSTVVVLNAGSEFSYPDNFMKGNREVKLTGEAYFNVTHNANAPFIIHTPEVDVKVLGTELNLKAYPNDRKTETALISGAVEVTVKNHGGRKILLKPNEKVTIQKDPELTDNEKAASGKMTESLVSANADRGITTGPAEEETAWMQNRLPFRNERFDDLALSIERRYGVNVVFNNGAAKSLLFSGNIQGESLTEILKILQQIHSFEYTITGKKVIIN